MIKRLRESETFWRHLNGWRIPLYLGLAPVAYFRGWVYSIAFVAVLSIVALAESSIASWRSDISPRLDRIEAKLDGLIKRLEEQDPPNGG